MRDRVVIVMVLAACSGKTTTSSSGGTGSSGSAANAGGLGGEAHRSGQCPVLDQLLMNGATPLTRWTAPTGCTLEAAMSPMLITDQKGFEAKVKCPAGTGFGQPLVVTTRSFSPAQVGLDVYDDGKTITFVSMQRPPCPNDPRPMPGPNETFAYPITGTGPRAFADASCTVPRACP